MGVLKKNTLNGILKLEAVVSICSAGAFDPLNRQLAQLKKLLHQAKAELVAPERAA